MYFFFEKKDKTSRSLIEKIILENYNQYYRLAYSYVHNESDAGDIVQNGAYQALRNAQSLKEPEYAKTWLYRIMLNECFRYVKQQRPLSYEAISEQNGFESASAEDHYVNIDLQRALDALSDKDKAIVILKYFEERTFDEIALILDENINTVKSRLYRSMDKLKDLLTDTR